MPALHGEEERGGAIRCGDRGASASTQEPSHNAGAHSAVAQTARRQQGGVSAGVCAVDRRLHRRMRRQRLHRRRVRRPGRSQQRRGSFRRGFSVGEEARAGAGLHCRERVDRLLACQRGPGAEQAMQGGAEARGRSGVGAAGALAGEEGEGGPVSLGEGLVEDVGDRRARAQHVRQHPQLLLHALCVGRREPRVRQLQRVAAQRLGGRAVQDGDHLAPPLVGEHEGEEVREHGRGDPLASDVGARQQRAQVSDAAFGARALRL
eukprot:1434937-Rhodomonas_salina.1